MLSKMKSHMAGRNLMTIGFKKDPANLQRVDISERRLTSADPVAMVTCRLENAWPDFVEESNLGLKIVSEYDQEIPQSQTADNLWHREEEPLNHHGTASGSADSSTTVEDTAGC